MGSLYCLRDVARDEAIAHGLLERLVERHVDVVHGTRGKGLQFFYVERAHMRGSEALELEASKGGGDVVVDYALVPHVAGATHRVLHAVLESPAEVVREAERASVENEASIPIRPDLVECRAGLGLVLARDVAPLRTVCGLHPVEVPR